MHPGWLVALLLQILDEGVVEIHHWLEVHNPKLLGNRVIQAEFLVADEVKPIDVGIELLIGVGVVL